MSYSPFTWKDDLAGGTPITAARLNTIEAGIQAAALASDTVTSAFGAVSAGAYKPLAGTGIDLTGVADSTTAVQAIFTNAVDGDVIVVPPRSIIKLTGTITVPKRVRLTGKGKLQWSGIPNSPALTLTANGTFIDGITMFGDGNAGQTGNQQNGISIAANGVRVIGCHIDSLQQAVCVTPTGEWHSNIIANNLITNVPGSGDGASNTTSNYGEDRGDGIVNWGASCVISGNRVTAKDGADCRIGIHTEALSVYEASTAYTLRDAMVTITGNVVAGKFRRGIVTEFVNHVTIVGNAVADATWWGIALINTYSTTCVGNTIKWTRTASDNQGAAWSPTRAAIMLYGVGASNVVQANTVSALSGTNMPNGICITPDSNGTQDDALLSSNVIVDNSGTLVNGVNMNGATNLINRPRIINNRFSGVSGVGVYGWTVADPEVMGNRIDGVTNTKTAYGIRFENNTTSLRCDGNTINWAATGILAVNRSTVCTINNNLINNVNYGIDLYGTAGATIVGNRILNVANTAANNFPSGFTGAGNNF